MMPCECHFTEKVLPWQRLYPQRFSTLSWGQLACPGHQNAGCTDRRAWPSKGEGDVGWCFRMQCLVHQQQYLKRHPVPSRAFYSSLIFYSLDLFKFVHLLRATSLSVQTVVCYHLEIKLLIISNFISRWLLLYVRTLMHDFT